MAHMSQVGSKSSGSGAVIPQSMQFETDNSTLQWHDISSGHAAIQISVERRTNDVRGSPKWISVKGGVALGCEPPRDWRKPTQIKLGKIATEWCVHLRIQLPPIRRHLSKFAIRSHSVLQYCQSTGV